VRRHALDRISRPLVVFRPTSMLRNRAVVSHVDDFPKDVSELPSMSAEMA
jgi:2-oxoglutarate decarboxylase